MEKPPVQRERLPRWMRKTVRENETVLRMKKILREKNLHTVCQSAGCPNYTECFQKPTATFMILGNVCTRNCRYCGVQKGHPGPVDSAEPAHIAETVQMLALKHVVITSVTRDDLPDGGAEHFAGTIRAIHAARPSASVEVLVPDFKGEERSLETVLSSRVDILNHNVETVPDLYAAIRPEADFKRSLQLINDAKKISPDVITKSGLMVGLGETGDQVTCVFKELREAGCDALTVGQYLQPSLKSFPVSEYVTPEQFEKYRQTALGLGFQWVYAGPFVRSSFNAEEVMISKMKSVSANS